MTPVPFAPELGGSRSGGAIVFPCLSSRAGSGTKVARTTFCGAEQWCPSRPLVRALFFTHSLYLTMRQ